MSPTGRFVLDASARRYGDGLVLIAGSPLKLFRLTTAGAALVDRIERRDDLALESRSEPAALSGPIARLLDRLLDAGAIHPLPVVSEKEPTVTIVIPAFATPPDVLTCIVSRCDGAANVIIVDDASPNAITPIPGALVIRHEHNRGPGAARNTGAALADTPLVAFVDTDVILDDRWLGPLVDHFADDRVALVAPRVASLTGDSVLERYESLRSPLDLGASPARIEAGSRVGYVPAAAIVVRLAAFRKVGGFDETLRVGEDVDLVWRLTEAGHRARYEPGSTVHHRPRPTLATWARQRFDYGSSAAPLAQRHGSAVAPLRISGWSVVVWSMAAAGRLVVAGIAATVTTALLARKLRNVPDGQRAAIRLAGLGHLYAGRSLASALTRAWWPGAAVAAVVSARSRRVLLIAACAPAMIDWIRTHPPVPPAAYVGLRILDDLAYGTGVAAGVVKHRSLDAVQADLRSWPAQRSSRTPEWSPDPAASA